MTVREPAPLPDPPAEPVVQSVSHRRLGTQQRNPAIAALGRHVVAEATSYVRRTGRRPGG